MNARDVIKSMLKKRKMRQSELARRMGVGRTTVNNQLSGTRWDLKDGSTFSMTVDTLLRYSNALGYRIFLVPLEDEIEGSALCLDEMSRKK